MIGALSLAIPYFYLAHVMVVAVRVGAALLTSGPVVWVLRSTFWAYLLVFGLPLWRDVDLLPIVARADGEGSATDDMLPTPAAERAVADVLDAVTSPLDDRRRRQ